MSKKQNSHKAHGVKVFKISTYQLKLKAEAYSYSKQGRKKPRIQMNNKLAKQRMGSTLLPIRKGASSRSNFAATTPSGPQNNAQPILPFLEGHPPPKIIIFRKTNLLRPILLLESLTILQ